MASGRMVTNKITSDKRINRLSSDTSRLAFTWLITFADCEGRTYGDPAMVRSMLFPRRDDVTTEMVERFIREWALLGLIVWYEAEDDLWIYFVNFDKNQPGLRKDKEAASNIPPPPDIDYDVLGTEEGRREYGIEPELLPLKLKEVKRKEVNAPPSKIRPEKIQNDIWVKIKGRGNGIPPTELSKIGHIIWDAYMRNDCNIEKTVVEGKHYFDEWCSRRGKDGKFYSPMNNAWIDWWVSGEIPEHKGADPPPPKRIKYDPYGNPVEVDQ